MKESVIETRFCREAKKAGYWQCKFTSVGTSGVPDRVLITPVGVWFVELKRPNGKPRDLQEWVQRQMIRAGGNVINLDTIEKVVQFFEYLKTLNNGR